MTLTLQPSREGPTRLRVNGRVLIDLHGHGVCLLSYSPSASAVEAPDYELSEII